MLEGVQVTCRSCSRKAILVHCICPSKVDQNQLFGPKSTFEDQNRLDLNSFKHFSGPKNKTLRTHNLWVAFHVWFSLRSYSYQSDLEWWNSLVRIVQITGPSPITYLHWIDFLNSLKCFCQFYNYGVSSTNTFHQYYSTKKPPIKFLPVNRFPSS